MTERKRLPDTRDSITQKLHIQFVGEDAPLESQIESLKDKLRRISALTRTRIPKPDLVNGILSVISEPDDYRAPIQDMKIYMQVGLYPDTGQPGEIFLKADKVGSTISGLLDTLSMSISVALQAGVPLEWFVEKMKNLQFSPAGTTNIPGIRKATSIVDGLARWLELRFLPR